MSVDFTVLVESPHWRWMPGMLVRFTYEGEKSPAAGSYAIRLDCDGWGTVIGRESARYVDDKCVDGTVITGLAPGLTDPATLGFLLALVREAWRTQNVYARMSNNGGWVVCIRDMDAPNGPVFGGPFRAATEAEALTAALLADPPKDGGS